MTTVQHTLTIDGSIATVTFDRPASYNALTADLLESLIATFKHLETNDTVRSIIVTGNGKGFCAGQALDDERTLGERTDGALATSVTDRFNPLLLEILTIEKPVVAAVNGVAAGAGFGIALACDFRIVSEAASFTTAFAKIGLVPDSGTSYLLPRFVGYGRAMEYTMLSEKIDAKKADMLGLVTKLVAPENLMTEARKLADALAHGPKSLGYIKRELVHNGIGELADALAFEAEMQGIAAATKDFAEGLDAFRNKRPPMFTGA
jgi:2-(1,2-epoxy-1,2-dihydrophenyl)acetyl-CoA isomerase